MHACVRALMHVLTCACAHVCMQAGTAFQQEDGREDERAQYICSAQRLSGEVIASRLDRLHA